MLNPASIFLKKVQVVDFSLFISTNIPFNTTTIHSAMVVNEFEPDEIFGELNRKFANVSLETPTYEDVYKEITLSDVSVFIS